MSLLTKNLIHKCKSHCLYVVAVLLLILLALSFRGETTVIDFSSLSANSVASNVLLEKVEEEKPPVAHIATPESVRAIYMTACVAGTPSLRDALVKLIDETEINSIIIDIKDFSGTISFDSGLAGDAGNGCRALNLPEFIRTLHDRGIYVIGRISVFQDSFYSKLHPELAVKKKSNPNIVWADRKGINFIEVGAKPYWDYIAALATKSYEIGFDELNFDYVRFPSDGDMQDIYFPFSNELIVSDPVNGRARALELFFKFLSAEMGKIGVVTSADLFGMTTTAWEGFDLNIGQVLERALPYFDYIAPMVYPSHYPAKFNGWADPNTVPGELIKFVMTGGVAKVEAFKNASTTPAEVAEKVSVAQLRPWLQDFDYGGNYDVAEVRAQIDATYAAGLDSWMLWAPSNRYTRGALKTAE